VCVLGAGWGGGGGVEEIIGWTVNMYYDAKLTLFYVLLSGKIITQLNEVFLLRECYLAWLVGYLYQLCFVMGN
jgi:hypothetical protein